MQSLGGQSKNCRFIHTLREGNKYADWLANLGQDANWGTTILDDPPDGLVSFLRSDAGGSLTLGIR